MLVTDLVLVHEFIIAMLCKTKKRKNKMSRYLACNIQFMKYDNYEG